MTSSKKFSVTRRSGHLASCVTKREDTVDMVVPGVYCHTDPAPEGTVYEETNIMAEEGVLSTRRRRRYREWMVSSGTVCVGRYGDRLYRSHGKAFYFDGQWVQGMTLPLAADVKRHFCHFDQDIVIMPDKYYYRPSTGAFGPLEADMTFWADVYANTYEVFVLDEYRDGVEDFTKVFHEGEAVQLHIEYVAANDTVPAIYDVITKITGKILPYSMSFDPSTFPATQDMPRSKVTVHRFVPSLEGMCVCNDRLFGYVGNTVYASAHGNVFSWSPVGLSDEDGYEKKTAHAEAFTACTVFQGKPVFFTENMISVLYGDSPATYTLTDRPLWGVAAEGQDTLVWLGGQLYYLSPQGVMVYDGDETTVLSDPLSGRVVSGAAGSDGRNYFLSAQVEREGTVHHMNLVYSPERGGWCREDDMVFSSFVYCNRVLYGLWLDLDGGRARLYTVAGDVGRDLLTNREEAGMLSSSVELADLTDRSHRREMEYRLKRLHLEIEVGEASTVEVYLSCDDSAFRLVGTVTADMGRYVTIPVCPNRCHRCRIRLEAKGHFKLYKVARVYV